MGLRLNNGMRPVLSQKLKALVREVLERDRAAVRTKLLANWERAKAVEEEIAAAAKEGVPREDLDHKLQFLRQRSWKLQARAESIDWELAEAAGVVDHGGPGSRWRPTAAEPF